MKTLALAVAALSVGLSAQAQPLPDTDALVLASPFIFRGTVQKLHAATMGAVKPSNRTIVVRVDEVFDSSPNLAGYAGRSVTVLLSQGQSAAQDEKALFFTKGLLYGDGVEVELVSKMSGESDQAKLLARPGYAKEVRLNAKIRQRYTGAELAVQGSVVEARDLPSTFRSEHDPMWTSVVIEVSKVAKGEVGRTVEVLYPRSRDVMWSRSPQFPKGTSGLWFLRHTKEIAGTLNIGTTGVVPYTALDPLDFHPSGQAETVLQMIASRRGGPNQ